MRSKGQVGQVDRTEASRRQQQTAHQVDDHVPKGQLALRPAGFFLRCGGFPFCRGGWAHQRQQVERRHHIQRNAGRRPPQLAFVRRRDEPLDLQDQDAQVALQFRPARRIVRVHAVQAGGKHFLRQADGFPQFRWNGIRDLAAELVHDVQQAVKIFPCRKPFLDGICRLVQGGGGVAVGSLCQQFLAAVEQFLMIGCLFLAQPGEQIIAQGSQFHHPRGALVFAPLQQDPLGSRNPGSGIVRFLFCQGIGGFRHQRADVPAKPLFQVGVLLGFKCRPDGFNPHHHLAARPPGGAEKRDPQPQRHACQKHQGGNPPAVPHVQRDGQRRLDLVVHLEQDLPGVGTCRQAAQVHRKAAGQRSAAGDFRPQAGCDGHGCRGAFFSVQEGTRLGGQPGERRATGGFLQHKTAQVRLPPLPAADGQCIGELERQHRLGFHRQCHGDFQPVGGVCAPCQHQAAAACANVLRQRQADGCLLAAVGCHFVNIHRVKAHGGNLPAGAGQPAAAEAQVFHLGGGRQAQFCTDRRGWCTCKHQRAGFHGNRNAVCPDGQGSRRQEYHPHHQAKPGMPVHKTSCQMKTK